MRSSKEKVIADCEWAINKILSQGSTTVTSMQFFKDVEYYLKHSTEIVPCKDCVKYEQETGRCKNKVVHGNAETWFCADGKRRGGVCRDG